MIRVSQTHIARRCKKLAENGLLKHVGHGTYVITDEGEAYLDEEYDAENGVYLSDSEGTSEAADAETNRA